MVLGISSFSSFQFNLFNRQNVQRTTLELQRVSEEVSTGKKADIYADLGPRAASVMKLHGREAAYILGDAGAALVFTSGKEAGVLAEADTPGRRIHVNGPEFVAAVSGPAGSSPVERDRDALAWLFYTSGTTGRPKGVMITHGMLMTMSLAYLADVDAATGEDTALYAAPMSHGAGIYNIVHVLVGARHVCPPSGGFDPAEIFDLARHHGQADDRGGQGRGR